MKQVFTLLPRWCVFLLILLSSVTLQAQWSNNSAVNTTVCGASLNQSNQKMISDGSGGTILVWQDGRGGTYTQKLNANGVAQWTANGVYITNTTNYDNTTVQLTSDGYGGVIIVWADTRNAEFDIYGQRVDSSGNVIWTAGGIPICSATNYQRFPSITTTGDGAIIAWQDQRNGGANSRELGIFAQKVNLSGVAQWTANGVLIIDLPQMQSLTRIVHDGANGAIIAMNDESNAYPQRITVQKVNSSGVIQWGTNGVQATTSTGFTQNINYVCSDGNGGMIVSWSDQRNGFGTDFYAQRISSNGARLWNNSGVHLSSGSGFGDNCYVAADGNGGAYFTYYKFATTYTLFAQHVSSAGAVTYSGTGAEISTGSAAHNYPRIVQTTEGNAIITWTISASNTIYAQKIDSTCSKLWASGGVVVANNNAEKANFTEITTDGGGGAIISFVENRAGNNFDIFAQQINAGGVLGSSPFASVVSVTSPNGGESLFAGETHNITWTSANIANVKIEYTTNNGTSWSTISASTSASAGTYAWTVPANTTAQGKVRISDASNNLITDQSNAVFSIVVGTLSLTAPNGGEAWVEARSQNITWSSSNVTNVKLEYSANNGTNWNTIIASTAAAAGSYSWSIPAVSSTNVLVRITDADHASLSDVSDAVFTLRQCDAPTWSFDPVGYQYTMNIVGKLYFEGNASQQVNDRVAVFVGNQLRGTAKVSQLAANTYRVYMTVYSNQESGEHLLFKAYDSLNCVVYPRVTQEYTFSANSVLGSLSSPVSLSATQTLPTLNLTAPNGGEGWIAQTEQDITWNSSSVSNIKIEYSTNNGANWSTITSSTAANTGSFAWTVPTVSSTEALVRLTNVFDTSYTDVSSAVFSLLVPTVTVTAPNGGETDTATASRNITWSSTNMVNVKIEYSSNNGADWNTIVASTAANTGSYAWTVPTITSAQMLFRVSDASNANFSDVSDAASSIVVPVITVTSPNGGGSYAATYTQNITWSSSNTALVKIEYSANNGTDWSTVVTSLDASVGTYAWTVPSINSAQVLVRVSNANFTSFNDTSDAVFSIFLPVIALTSPNGGEFWNAGTTQNITWTSSNVTNVKIEFSTDSGTSWSAISANSAASSGTYAWTVPSISTLNALVRISDALYTTFTDASNSNFALQMVDRYMMNAGWTWVSFNKVVSNMSVNNVLAGLTPTVNDLIKDQTKFAQAVSDDVWFGSLDSIKNTSAYLVKMAHRDSMEFAGQSVAPQTTPIAVSSGWNYISYVPQTALSVNSALASLDVRNEDLVKSQFAFAIYDSLYGWAGDMQQMQPKQGYLLKSALANTLTYPSGAKNMTPMPYVQYAFDRSLDGQPEWSLNVGQYPNSMSVVATLANGIISNFDGETVLGVFKNNECRGFAKAQYSEITGGFVFYLTVYGDAAMNDSLNFRVFDGKTNTSVVLPTGLIFESNSLLGKLRVPFVVQATTLAVQSEIEVPAEFSLMQNYPNPFNPSTTIGYTLAKESDVQIAIYNVMGEKVKELVNDHKAAGRYQAVWDGKNNYNEVVSSGVYIYAIRAGNFQMVKKLTFLK